MPKAFVFENVHTFAAKRQKWGLEYVIKTGRQLGYNVGYKVLNAVNYGVPQRGANIHRWNEAREGIRNIHQHLTGPRRFDLLNSRLPVWRTAGDAISDLDTELNDHSLKGHFAGGKDHELLKSIPPGENYLFSRRKEATRNLYLNGFQILAFSSQIVSGSAIMDNTARRSNNMGPFIGVVVF